MGNKIPWLIIAALVLCFVLFGGEIRFGGRMSEPVSDTVRITVVDTILYYKPNPKEEKRVGAVTDRLALAKPKKGGNIDEEDNFPIKADSADVEIPITQKVYEDSTYRAVISGYNVSLDELAIYPRREISTIRLPAIRKRWSFGIQCGVGITPKGVQPYLGVGGQFNF